MTTPDETLIRALRDALKHADGFQNNPTFWDQRDAAIAAADARLSQPNPSTEILGSGTPNTAPESGEQPFNAATLAQIAAVRPDLIPAMHGVLSANAADRKLRGG